MNICTAYWKRRYLGVEKRLEQLEKEIQRLKGLQPLLYCDHDYSGGNYSICPKCGELIR